MESIDLLLTNDNDQLDKIVETYVSIKTYVGQMVRTNHGKWREFLSSKELENSYVDHLNHIVCSNVDLERIPIIKKTR